MSLMKVREGEKEWILKAAAGVAVSIFLYAIVVQPVFQDILTARQDLMNSKKRIELYKEIQGLRKDLERKESPLATLTERSQLLGRISDIAGRTQVRFGTLTPRTEPNEGFLKLRVEMDGRGTFFSLLKFLVAIEKTQTLIKVKDISMLWNSFSKQQEGGSDALQIQLVLETLLKQRVKKTNA
ncbi:MAG: type 4a pilus biogenesis protein PilO [Candidatus Omnitrophota bacterium]